MATSGAVQVIVDAIERGAQKTVPELFFWRAAQAPNAEALRHKVGGVWRSISFREWESDVRALAAALVDRLKPGDRVSILSENRPEWTIADLASLCLGAVVAPIYATDPPKDIAYILADSEARILFVSTAEQLAKVRPLLGEGKGPLELVVVFDRVPEEDGRVVTLESLLARGRGLPGAAVDARVAAVKPADIMTLIYTSGTTGDRKGVMLTHENVVGNVDRAVKHIGPDYFQDTLFLSFLPLSHSLERTSGYYTTLRVGGAIAYAESIEKLPENLLEVRPSVLISVPRIYEKVYARVQAMAAASPVKRRILAWASEVGRQAALADVEKRPRPLLLRLRYRIAHRLVFRKLHERLGGRLRFACTGGAALPKDIAIFLRAAGLLVIEGYGLTETSPVLTLNGPDNMRFGSVGRPIPDVELKIEPEPGYSDREGEILARGPNIMRGYYKKEDVTRATLQADGWFRTGDIGYLDADGYLFITDRKKELLKTSGGKYVAPAPIEGRLNLHALVEQSCVIGNRRKYCVALMVPNFEALEKQLGRPLPADRSTLNDDLEVLRLFQPAIDAANEGLGSWEQIKRFALLPHELTQQTGELTPTQKMKRRVIDEKYQDLIDRLYPAE